MRKFIAKIIPIKGMIVSGEGSPIAPFPLLPFTGGGATFSDDITRYLRQIDRQRRIKALVFEIDSPGGSPYASKEIADAIKNIDKPTVAQIREHGTSGAYWIAAACNRIVADPLSSIGGIGTRADRLDLSELAKKIGIKIDTFAKGEFKGMSPYSQMSEKEKEFIQEHVGSFNQFFVKEISNNRNIKDEKILSDITSGKSYLGSQALEIGLIDFLGGNEKALEVAESMAKTKLVPDYRKGSFERPGLVMRMLRKIF